MAGAITYGRNQRHKRWILSLKMDGQGVHMFDGKNNRILDSFSFRVAVTAAVFAAWSAAGYALLYLA
jgi:hypothetical protein